ncbi:MAG: class I SAM-dependent methyltransferase [Chloroflexi bacterium]|nr:class I SAM-dependent methyltransferase [Chloroflexota bacterium]
MAAQFDIDRNLDRVLDVACGTGLSCIALKQIAKRIVGSDISAAMLAQAERDERIDYLRCPAEALPLASRSFDLLTVSSGLHWFERHAFLAEARRVLRPRGWLVIYDSFFSANLRGNPAFKPWFNSTYLQRFPTPLRDNQPLGDQSARHAGFHLLAQEKYASVVFFDREQLVDYLLTQTNVLAAIQGGDWTLNDARTYLTDEVSPYVPSSEPQAFDFGGPIAYLRKIG